MGVTERKGERFIMQTETVRTLGGSMREVNSLLQEAVNELLHYHEQSGKQKIKNVLKKAAGRYIPPEDLIFWPTGMLANTLAVNYEKWECKETVLAALRSYFDRWIRKGMPVYYMDDVLSGEALLDLYSITGDEKYKNGAERMIKYLFHLQEQAADETGGLPYRPAQKNNHIYADGIGMMCPFLCKYGTRFNDDRAVDLALKQIENMQKYGMSDKMQLPYHGYEYKSEIKYGIIGWGRAVGWLLLGMSGVLTFLPKEHSYYQTLMEEYRNLIKNVSAYQWEDGDFTWQLEAWEGPRDSSATSMIALAVLKGIEAGVLGEEEPISRALVKRAAVYLKNVEKNGKIYECSGECLGFGQYPQFYSAFPWSLAPGLAVLVRIQEVYGDRI